MRRVEDTLAANYVLKLYAFLEQEGYPMRHILLSLGIDVETFNPQAQLPVDIFLTLLQQALKLKPDGSLGMRFGLNMDINQHGFLGYGIRASKTVADAIQLAERYSHTCTSLLAFETTMDNDNAVVHIKMRAILGDLLPIILDLFVTSFLVIGEQVLGARGGVEIHLSYPKQSYHTALDKFGHRLIFNSAHNKFIIPKDALNFNLKTFDPLLVQMVTTQCEIEGQKVSAESSLLLAVQKLAEQHLCEEQPFEKTAAYLHLTPRTLRRRLADLGTTYQQMTDEIRYKLAIEKLLHTHHTIETVAADLGYQDTANFRRAFKRWTGLSPKQYKEQNKFIKI